MRAHLCAVNLQVEALGSGSSPAVTLEPTVAFRTPNQSLGLGVAFHCVGKPQFAQGFEQLEHSFLLNFFFFCYKIIAKKHSIEWSE